MISASVSKLFRRVTSPEVTAIMHLGHPRTGVPTVNIPRFVQPCHSEAAQQSWESVFLRCKAPRRLWRQGLRIATPLSRLAMTIPSDERFSMDNCQMKDESGKWKTRRGLSPTTARCAILAGVFAGRRGAAPYDLI